MAIGTNASLYGLYDGKLSVINSDSSSGISNGSAIDIPVIQEASFTSRVSSIENRGDDRIKGVSSINEAVEFSFKNAQISLQNLEVLTGSPIIPSGTTPNQLQTSSFGLSTVPKYFTFAAQSRRSDSDTGDISGARILLYKCKITSLNWTLSHDNSVSIDVSGIAIPTIYNGKIMDTVLEESSVDIAI